MNVENLTPEQIQEHIDKTRSPQHRHELHWLIAQVNKINPKVIVEIGVERGGTTSLWRRVFDYELMIGIDTHDNKQEIKFDGIKNKFILGNSALSGTKGKLRKDLGGRKIDFLFIDGDHSYELAKEDFINYSQFVRKDGLIGFHDITSGDSLILGGPGKLFYELEGKKEKIFVELGMWTGVLYLWINQ